MTPNYEKHFPVMLPEVLKYMEPAAGETYVDATFGNGGYSEALLQVANCKVIALDRDPSVAPRARELQKLYGSRFEFRPGCFGNLAVLVGEAVNGVVFDVGVSSMQLDQGERGFSFAKEAPLDMRMSQTGVTAADIVNSYKEEDLADLIYRYGEERKSRQIARRLVEARKTAPIATTRQLADIVHAVVRRTPNGTDPATRTFQALRIAVNNELGELEQGLAGALERLVPGGRLVVVDFHSLEDRLVKNFFKQKSGKTAAVSRYMPAAARPESRAELAFVSKAVLPSAEEIDVNPRSRSAKLRYARKSNPGKDNLR